MVHAVFLLSYGGGLVAGDSIDLETTLTPFTRLVLLSQGSTKVFKASNDHLFSFQNIRVRLEKGSAICHLPEPVQPFAESSYKQNQIFEIQTDHESLFQTGREGASLFVCDWASDGRPARNEHWNLRKYVSKLDVWAVSASGERRLLLRDNTVLQADSGKDVSKTITDRVGNCGVCGTLLIYGPLFVSLGNFFVTQFTSLRKTEVEEHDRVCVREKELVYEDKRLEVCGMGRQSDIVWTASTTRGVVIVKFSAATVECAKHWMRAMLLSEGTLEREFGERSMMSLL